MFYIFSDKKKIEEQYWAPVNLTVLTSFISTLAGTYGDNTIWNYIYGIRAWHIMHGTPWKVNDNEVDTLLKAVMILVIRGKNNQPLGKNHNIRYFRSLFCDLGLKGELKNSLIEETWLIRVDGKAEFEYGMTLFRTLLCYQRTGGRQSERTKPISNLRSKHGTLGLSIYTNVNLCTDHVCIYLYQ